MDYCETICGDYFLAGKENCEDGNSQSGDGCDNVCEKENGFFCDQFFGSQIDRYGILVNSTGATIFNLTGFACCDE